MGGRGGYDDKGPRGGGKDNYRDDRNDRGGDRKGKQETQKYQAKGGPKQDRGGKASRYNDQPAKQEKKLIRVEIDDTRKVIVNYFTS